MNKIKVEFDKEQIRIFGGDFKKERETRGDERWNQPEFGPDVKAEQGENRKCSQYHSKIFCR